MPSIATCSPSAVKPTAPHVAGATTRWSKSARRSTDPTPEPQRALARRSGLHRDGREEARPHCPPGQAEEKTAGAAAGLIWEFVSCPLNPVTPGNPRRQVAPTRSSRPMGALGKLGFATDERNEIDHCAVEDGGNFWARSAEFALDRIEMVGDRSGMSQTGGHRPLAERQERAG